jgi:site-specific DNA-methyltransferase (adenine-specific)
MSKVKIPVNQIICGDCLEVMKDWPDNSIDITFCDPPYGMNYHSGHYQSGNPHLPIHDDDRYATEGVKQGIRLARNAVYAFCRWDNIQDLPEKPKSFIVWKKNNWTAGDLEHAHGRMWEGIGFWPQAEHQFNRRLPDVLDCPRIPATDLKHPTEKPIGLVLRIIEANVGDLILDPFCGSGTTCVAAKMLGRRYIGIDISEEYCQIARDRLKAVDTGVPVKEARAGQMAMFNEAGK